jgi:unsaturated chondroitin disaccharide hydrolase
VPDFSRSLSGWRAGGGIVHRPVILRDGNAVSLRGRGSLSHPLPVQPPAVSFDLRLPGASALSVRLGSVSLRFVHRRRSPITLAVGQAHFALHARPGWPHHGSRHVELVTGAPPGSGVPGAPPPSGALAVDGRKLPVAVRGGRSLALSLRSGTAQIAGLIATSATDRDALVLHRLAELRARTPLGRFPLGTGQDGRLRFGGGWTSGFWPGALWRAFDLTGSGTFRDWALAATVAHLGDERKEIHDQGFRYGESSVAAFSRLCARARPSRRHRGRMCRRLRRSGLTAARALLRLAGTNRPAGMIPTAPPRHRCRRCRSSNELETIIDSVMNLSLLSWAWRETGQRRYQAVALRHAQNVGRLLVRPDGSTAQGLVVRRSDGAVTGIEQRQGLSASSTWSRGQGWAVHGFAETGLAFRDRSLIAVAERTAEYVFSHLPAAGVPPWDYDAPNGAPLDTSAGVITAAGLFRLDVACRSMPGACARPDRWRPLAERMLTAALRYVRTTPPLGLLGAQVYSLGGRSKWDDNGEFLFGVDYALEAIHLSL